MKKRILCFGDSNTWGYIPDSPPIPRYNEDIRWTARLQNLLGSDWQVLDFGLCGCEASGKDKLMGFTASAKTLFTPVLFASLPVNIVLIMLGTNDLNCLNDWKPDDTAAGLKSLVDTVRAISPKTRVAIASPVILKDKIAQDPKFDETAPGNSRLQAKEVAELCVHEKIPFFDTNEFVHELSIDGCHFTPQDHKAFAESIAPFVQSLMF